MRPVGRGTPWPNVQEENAIRFACAATIALVLAASGCGPRKIVKDVKNDPPEKRMLHTGAGKTINRQEGGGPVQWVVEWESADVDYLTEREYGGRMYRVKGELYDKNRPVSSFRADGAQADKKTNRLMLEGNVTLTAKEPPSTMKCARLVWDAGRGVVKATENVNLNTLDYRMGPIPELWATPKMDLIATPALFGKPGDKAIMDMHSLKLGLMAAATAAGAAASGTQMKPWVFEDKGGNMTVENISNTKNRTLPNGKLAFAFAGSPLHATWKEQGVTIDAPTLVGTAEKAGGGRYRLAEATMAGGIIAKVVRPSTNPKSSEEQTVTVTGEQALYDAKERRLTVTGGVKIVGDDAGMDQHIEMTGKSATVNLGASQGAGVDGGIASAVVEGPAHVVVDASEPLKSGGVQKSHSVGDGDKLEYKLDGNLRKIALDGNSTFQFELSVWKDGKRVPSKKDCVVDLAGNRTEVGLAVKEVKGENVLRSAEAKGSPVQYTFQFTRMAATVKGGEAVPVLGKVTGSARNVAFRALDRSERNEGELAVWSVLTLTGDVEAHSGQTGYDELQGGSFSGWDKVVLELAQNGDVLNIDGEGRPGKTTIVQNPPADKGSKKASTGKGKAK